MSVFSDLLEKPGALSVASQYTTVNGMFYLASGLLMLAWPGVVQTIFMDATFAGHEEALVHLIGMLLALIGWFYVFGGRSGARQFVAATVVVRVTLVPMTLGALALAGVFPHVMTTFAILDPVLAIGAWLLLGVG